MKANKILATILAVLSLSLFALAGIDLTDPTQTGGKTSGTLPGLGTTYIEGKLYSAGGQPLKEGKIYISIGTKSYQAYSDFQGYFRLNLPLGELPNMIILQVEANGYIPENRVYYTSNLRQNDYSFNLAPLHGNYILIDPRAHHLGDDLYTGLANSQFQLPTEGLRYQTSFNLPLPPGQIERAILRLTVKGAEFNNPIEINGHKVGYLKLKNNFGNSGELQLEIPANVLRNGSNTLSISSYYDNDYDDFEFSNVRLEIVPKQVFNAPKIEIHEPLDGSQITSYDLPAKVNLKATVSADYNISSIAVNGKILGGVWGRYAGINEILSLSAGRNTITIEASDIYGQTTKKTLALTVLSYPSFSYSLNELFSLSFLNEHQNALRYLQNSLQENTLAIYYPMWGEKHFHSSFLERYRFLDTNRLDLPAVFRNGETKITNFSSYYSPYIANLVPQFNSSYRDTSTYNRLSGRLNLEYIPANIYRDLAIYLILAETNGYNTNYVEAREVFQTTRNRSYQTSSLSIDIPVSFSQSPKTQYRYILAIHDANTKELLYCRFF